MTPAEAVPIIKAAMEPYIKKAEPKVTQAVATDDFGSYGRDDNGEDDPRAYRRRF